MQNNYFFVIIDYFISFIYGIEHIDDAIAIFKITRRAQSGLIIEFHEKKRTNEM